MRMASLPIAVIMQRRSLNHRWASESWAAVGVVADGGLPRYRVLSQDPPPTTWAAMSLR